MESSSFIGLVLIIIVLIAGFIFYFTNKSSDSSPPPPPLPPQPPSPPPPSPSPNPKVVNQCNGDYFEPIKLNNEETCIPCMQNLNVYDRNNKQCKSFLN